MNGHATERRGRRRTSLYFGLVSVPPPKLLSWGYGKAARQCNALGTERRVGILCYAQKCAGVMCTLEAPCWVMPATTVRETPLQCTLPMQAASATSQAGTALCHGSWPDRPCLPGARRFRTFQTARLAQPFCFCSLVPCLAGTKERALAMG